MSTVQQAAPPTGAVSMRGRYTGNLGVELKHGPSGASITTAAPVDNQGDGSSFSPTDLVAAALGACMVTIIGIAARRLDVDLAGCTFEVDKLMHPEPRRIGRVPIKIFMPAGIDTTHRRILEGAARSCPVCRSLSTEVETSVSFEYPD